ncbi:30S ribosomal protein S20 [Ichthyobacterium seriolicida]|uniref:Small ribosomal subunit protein bS20 n=1 Tax=Ichthyobacterium seriolicida TaxID=242600 RepID=A0A1J1EBT2_9FLAO|nr:30S ribosomal protein S20 [Ichthyobacterium seriolicida]BAV94968.1 30S ribosomal protein S20 [Ichthyobacterium seriolicida]
MANHKSALKRIRSNETKRLRNKQQYKSVRSIIKKLRLTTVKEEALSLLPVVHSLVDKLAKKSVIHKNKASNLKSKLSAHVSSLA